MKTNLIYVSFATALALLASGVPASGQIELQQRLQNEVRTNRSLADSGTHTVTTVPADFDKLRIAPGFLLALNVLDDADYSGTYRVDERGEIQLPFIGSLHVAGASAAEASSAIRQKLLDNKILNNPQVMLSIAEYTAPEVTILGEVGSAGKYPLLAPRKLVDVLALAGGPTDLAGDMVQITSATPGNPPVQIHYSRSTDPKDVQSVLVHPGDTILVKRAGIVYVLGGVNRAGGFVMQDEGKLTMLQAVSLAMGTANTASTRNVYLLRRNDDGTVVHIALPYKKIVQGKSTDVALRPSDVLFIPTSIWKLTLNGSQAILSAAASATVYRGM